MEIVGLLFPKLRKRPKRRREGPTLHGEPCTMQTLRRHVFERDQGCIARVFAIGREPHECRDKWGEPHSPLEVDRLTLAHVPERGQNGLGLKPPDDELHTVAECYGSNVLTGPGQGPTHELREFERRWIAEHEPVTV